MVRLLSKGLTAKRDTNAAKRFFIKALKATHTLEPRVINVDKNPSYPPAMEKLKKSSILPEGAELRQVKYLNNMVEQDHRRVKHLINPGMSFGSFNSARRTIKGYHTITEGNGMPLANRTTAANDSEREQVLPLLDSIKIHTGKPGRPRKRFSVLAADKGYDSHEKRSQLRRRGIRPQFPKRVYKSKKHRGRPIKSDTPRFQQERCFAWYQRKYRRLVVRWERQSLMFDGFLALGMIHLWITKIILVG